MIKKIGWWSSVKFEPVREFPDDISFKFNLPGLKNKVLVTVRAMFITVKFGLY